MISGVYEPIGVLLPIIHIKREDKHSGE